MQSQAQPGSIEVAKGDGNCAFNAFALGLCDPAVLAKVRLADDNYFVAQASRALALQTTTSWSELKTALLISDRQQLQSALAPLLREIAIQTILKDRIEKQKHLTATQMALAVEFENYIRLKNDAAQPDINNENVGDIFYRHQFIKDKFTELQAKSADNNVTLLLQWWNTLGQNKFLDEMKKNAVYAGDLELAPLGRFFGVNLNVHSMTRNLDTQIYHADGRIPQTLQSIRDLDRTLADRNIIYQDTNWKRLTKTELTARLSAVPQHDEVRAIINTLPRTDAPVPAQLGEETLNQLYARGIVDRTKTVFALNINEPAVALQRVGEVAQKDLIIREWEKTYKEAATINLQNENALHWNTVHLTVVPSTPKATTAYQAKEGEKDVNDAVNTVFDLLNSNRPPMTEQEVKKHFEKAYEDLSKVLQEFQAKRIDMGFFKKAKEDIVQEVEQKVSKIRSKL